MSFDRETRNMLARTVISCRRLLTADVTEQMGGTYGLHSDGTELSIEKLTHLSPDKLATARDFRELLNYYEAKESGDDKRSSAYNRIILETSFTILNRLVALRMSEERKLIIESIAKGFASDGFRLFEQLSGGALGSVFETYCIYLECLFDEVALDLGILFDRSSPQSKIFPTENCLTAVLAEINKVELKELWKEDETIGWVYQYFNPQEERKDMRDASQAPRTSRELAVRNQFFTPRYVVEFLTDNTLGRTWYEMRKGETILKESCNYLVRRPNELFLAKEEIAPTVYDNETELSQEELLKQPVYIEHRPKKDPRDIKVLDPACGSGHFLLYAFDLLEQIYLEAWEDRESAVSEATGKALHEDYESKADLLRAVPELVVRWNLYGIDIDQRAVQIAALALWLRAQKSWLAMGLKSHERPHISKSNIVTAEPMPGDGTMRQEFTETLQPKLLGQIVNVVFEKMKLAGEAGSLLKIEEEIADVVRRAKEQWVKRPKLEQSSLFVDSNELKQGELEFDLSGVTDEAFWGQAEASIFEALKRYSEGAESGGSLKRRLFKEDAAGGFAFIDLCRNRYDVILMNPPFGDYPKKLEDMYKKYYSLGWIDLYACFLIRTSELLWLNGFCGCITSRTFLHLSRLKKLRNDFMLKKFAIRFMVDLGAGILDTAAVETCMSVFLNNKSNGSIFIDLKLIECQSSKLISLTKELNISGIDINLRDVYLHKTIDFNSLPDSVFAYHVENMFLRLFNEMPSLNELSFRAYPGLTTLNNERFIRLHWEVPLDSSRWISFVKGGSGLKYYQDVYLVIDWGDSGKALKERAKQYGGSASRFIANEQFYFQKGLTYPRVGKDLSVRLLPANCIFAEKGISIFNSIIEEDLSNLNEKYLALLAFLNTRLVDKLVSVSSPGRFWEAGALNRIPTNPKIFTSELADLGLEGFNNAQQFYQGIETSRAFYTINKNNNCELLAETVEKTNKIVNSIYKIEWNMTDSNDGKCDIEYFCLTDSLSYGIGCLFGRWDLRLYSNTFYFKDQKLFMPLSKCPPGMLLNPSGLPAEPGNIVSEEWLRARPDAGTLPPEGSVKNPTIKDEEYPLRISWEGILVDDPGIDGGQPHSDDIVGRVREVLGVIWRDKAGAIEEEACDLLGVNDLRDYFRKPSGFFQDHVKRYSKSRRKAPIYWPLSTTSGSYTLWIYYHCLNDQTLYTAVNKYVEPKIDELERAIDRIYAELAGGKGTNQAGLKERQRKYSELLAELKEFREELLRVAALPYKPNLNDGVIINAAPLNKLFGLRSWAKDTAECWKKLEKGEYDWAHMAFMLWPERVKEKSGKDRTLAIAHDL